MHELSIAQALLDEAIKAAQQNNINNIIEITVHLGEFRCVDTETLMEAFKAVALESPAQKAKLTLIEIPTKAKCLKCGHAFKPCIDNYLCPLCNIANVQITQGKDIIIASLTGESLSQ